jgi:sigma-E factor negative regulatory protein RseC
MPIEENGTVVESRGSIALVRMQRSSACSGCASAGACHADRGEGEHLLEARNDIGAVAGEAVRVAVSARAVLGASARIYLLPVAGLVAGAGAAQVLAAALISAEAGERAAGVGGIAGAILGLLLARRLVKRAAGGGAPLPRITRIVTGVDSLRDRG